MLITVLISTVDGFIANLRSTHQKSLSSPGLESDEKKAAFENIEYKLEKIRKASGKQIDFDTMGDYVYSQPGGLMMKAVDQELINGELAKIKSDLTALKASLVKTNYRIVDAQTNKVFFLSSTEKGLFGKTISDIEALQTLYSV